MSDPPQLDYATPPPPAGPVGRGSVALGIAGTAAYAALFTPALLLWIGLATRSIPRGDADLFCFALPVLVLGWRLSAAVRHGVGGLGRGRAG